MLRTQIIRIMVVSLLLTVAAFTFAAAEDAKPTPTPKAMATPDAKPEQMNINTATLDELVTLPGIGPKTAQKIVDTRPFATVDAILNVKGIGPSKLEKMRRLITVDEEQDDEIEEEAESKTEQAEATPTPEQKRQN